MSIQKTFNITLKYTMTEWGTFESIRLLKGKSQLSDQLLESLNKALECSFAPAPAVKTTVEIGNLAEQEIFSHLQSISNVNMDFQVTDTSNQTGHGDMSVHHQDKLICVEIKNYSKPVPMKELDKYHKSLNLAEYDAGIMIQMNSCGFAREANLRSPIDIKVVDGKPSAYLTNIDKELLYPIINFLIANSQIGTDNIDELDNKKKALIQINEKLSDLRSSIEFQKKGIDKMEQTIQAIAKLTMI